ncbi:MAG: hypothetical protein AAGA43_15815 [Bacteroidota bacterium]
MIVHFSIHQVTEGISQIVHQDYIAIDLLTEIQESLGHLPKINLDGNHYRIEVSGIQYKEQSDDFVVAFLDLIHEFEVNPKTLLEFHFSQDNTKVLNNAINLIEENSFSYLLTQE